MKILIVSPGYPRWQGDYEHPMVRNVARQLTQAGHRIRVVTIAYPNVPSREIMEGVEIIRARYGPNRLQILGGVGGILDELRTSRLCRLLLLPMLTSLALQTMRNAVWADMLLVQWVPTAVVALPAKWVFRRPLILHSRTYADTKFWRAVYRFLLRQANGVIYNSADNQRQTEQISSHPNTTVIGSGINLTQYQGRSPERRRDGAVHIISVARLVEFKGLEYAIRAMEILRRRGRRVKLTIAGDGPLRKDLERLIGDLNLEDEITLAGALPHDRVVEELFRSDVFILPSIIDSRGRTEGFGAVLLEAMAAQLPVVASAVGGIVDTVNASTGILVPEKDPEALADAIASLLDDPSAAAAYVAAAHQFVQAQYSDEAITKRLARFLEATVAVGASA